MIPKTAISVKLRAIPPSAGLSRIYHKKTSQFVTGHYVKPRYYLTVETDKDLEAEIKKFKEVNHDSTK